jgi:uncharacterized protein YcbK (DUF882 family)
MNLTKNFTLEELIKSQYASRNGIDNTPNEEQIENLKQLCINILQPLRDALGVPLHIDSGFRNFEINEAIGGAKNSQHTKGQAADVTVSGMTPMDVIKKVVALRLPFDQMIFEYGEWMHVSYNEINNRGEILSKTNGVPGYPVLIL